MRRSLIGFTALLAGATALEPAAAQTGQAPVAANGVAPAPAGFVLAQGLTFVPQVFSEIGYDTNPSQAFYGPQGSAFSRSGAGFNVSSVSQTAIASLSATGSMLDYFNNPGLDDPRRYAGSAHANVAYLVQPGLTASSGAFIDYDGQSVSKSQSAGGNWELAYRNTLLSSVLRGRFTGMRYLDNSGLLASPLSLTSQFNYNRSEAVWLGLLGNDWRVSPYAELSVARVDYTDQPNPSSVNRSADDYYAKAGARWTVSPVLSADIGWRFNQRDTDDRRITSLNSNAFDGSLTWLPSPVFFMRAYVERTIGEPTIGSAILADVRSYNVKATYLPVRGVTVTAGGGWQVENGIGSGIHYQTPYADGRVAWDYNDHVQFYTSLRYQGYGIDWQALGYDEVRVMTGVSIVPDGKDILHGESVERMLARLAGARLPSNSELTVSGGYSWFGLPDMKMVTIVGGQFFDQALGQQTNGDGSLNGWRTDARLDRFAEGTLADGRLVSFGVSGFYANYQGTTNSRCTYGLTSDCAIVNIVDLSRSQEDNTGPFGDLKVKVRRDVDYYGVAVDARIGWWTGGGLKDGPAVQELSPFRVGVAMRGISETASLTANDPLVCDPVNYKESLDAHYYGGFVGVEHKEAFGDGWIAGLDATGGVYYTDTEYQGRYNGYTVLIPAGYVQETGNVNASSSRGSFIGTLRLDLKRQLGWGTAGVYGQGEYLSYVPHVAYNNNDQAGGGAPWGIAGTQTGTRIASSDALNFTTGLSLSVPLN